MLVLPATTLLGCGSGSTGGTTPPDGGGTGGGSTPPPQTQTYNLTIIATSSSVTQSIPVTLIVN